MVRSFSDTWQAVEELLVAGADSLGISASAISSGEPDEAIAPVPPYIKIFALPDSEFGSDSYSPELEFMRFTLFVAGLPGDSFRRSVQNAVQLALRARKYIIASLPAIIQDESSKIVPHAIFSNYTLVSFDLICPYLSYED